MFLYSFLSFKCTYFPITEKIKTLPFSNICNENLLKIKDGVTTILLEETDVRLSIILLLCSWLITTYWKKMVESSWRLLEVMLPFFSPLQLRLYPFNYKLHSGHGLLCDARDVIPEPVDGPIQTLPSLPTLGSHAEHREVIRILLPLIHRPSASRRLPRFPLLSNRTVASSVLPTDFFFAFILQRRI